MTFRFRLQTVLEFRSQQIKESFAIVEQLRQKIRELHHLLNSERSSYLEERDQLNHYMRLSSLIERNIYEKSLEKRQSHMLNLLQNLRDFQQELEMQEQTMQNFQKQEKALSKLKSSQQKKHEDNQVKLEQKILDELSLQAYQRQQ